MTLNLESKESEYNMELGHCYCTSHNTSTFYSKDYKYASRKHKVFIADIKLQFTFTSMRDFVNWESRRFIVPLYNRINSFISGVFWVRVKEGGRWAWRLWVEERVLKVPLKSKSISSGSKRCYSFDYSPSSALDRVRRPLGGWEARADCAHLTDGPGSTQSMLHLKIDWSVILEPRFIWLRAISQNTEVIN